MSRASGAREEGAVAVEAALVTAVIFAMIFGILEMAFLMRDYVGVTSAARVGVRAASTGAAAGPCVADPADTTPCPPRSVPELAQMAADAVASARTVLPEDAIDYIMVYEANAHGYPGTATSMPDLSGCATECVAYRWSSTQRRFRYAQGSWDSSRIFACADPRGGDSLEGVGVHIAVDHDFLTGVFGSAMGISDHSVMSFEPLSNVACGRGEHQ
jgi:hypothetical protein